MIRFIYYKAFPAVLLLLFILIMNSGNYLKQPFGLSDNVPEYFSQLKDSITGNQWDKASDNLENLQFAWRRVIKRIQFSVERNEINNFQHSMARFKGFLEAHDKSGVFAELEEMKETWDDLGQ